MHYKTTTREGYKEYVGKAEECDKCPNRAQCFSVKSKFKTIRRHVWETSKEDVVKFTKTDKGRSIYRRRKETIERSFAGEVSAYSSSAKYKEDSQTELYPLKWTRN